MVEQQQLVILLLRLAVAASLASILVRFTSFQRMLMREERTLVQRLKLGLSLSAVFGAGVATRVLSRPAYLAVDLGMEGSLLSGMVGGYVTGLLSGVLISLPAMFRGELMSMPFFAGVGVLGGLLRDIARDKEEVWRFSPLLDLSIYRLLKGKQDLRRSAFQLVMLLSILSCEFLRFETATQFNGMIFSLSGSVRTTRVLSDILIYLSTIFAVTLPLKIWNNSRNEKKLEAQQSRLNEARLAALTSQINPHFLFNTLNSVSSLIRTNPEQARNMVYKLSRILRRLLRTTDAFTSLREELSFIDNYMAIEMVRFGEKLRFTKEIDPATMDMLVPSMLLQPIIENSIKHGLSSKVDGGAICVRSRLENTRLQLTVEDDGVGIPEPKLATLFEQGIGVSNVNERLKVLFGNDYRMWIESKSGEGTRTGIEIVVRSS